MSIDCSFPRIVGEKIVKVCGEEETDLNSEFGKFHLLFKRDGCVLRVYRACFHCQSIVIHFHFPHLIFRILLLLILVSFHLFPLFKYPSLANQLQDYFTRCVLAVKVTL